MSKNIEYCELDELDDLDNLDDNEIKILDKYKISFPAAIGCGKITNDYIRKLIQKLSQN